MEYTSYGLGEGMLMVSGTIFLVLLMYAYKMFRVPKEKRGLLTLVVILSIICIGLDTLMWVLSIQTGVIDFLIGEKGSQEQVTIFGVASYILIFRAVLMLPKIEEDETYQKH